MDKDALPLYFSMFNEVGIISQLSRALMDMRLPDGLTTSHFGVVNHLIRVEDGQTPLDLARSFQVPKTTMTHTLAGLEKHKLVEMRPNPADGRSKCVWLTEKGREFRANAVAAFSPDMARLALEIPPEQMKALVAGLVEIRSLLDDWRQPG